MNKNRTENLHELNNRNRNKFINQIRALGGHIQITIMIDTTTMHQIKHSR
jgi:hypothetical protein